MASIGPLLTNDGFRRKLAGIERAWYGREVEMVAEIYLAHIALKYVLVYVN